ncbi:hypothetical protein N7676_15895 [Stenotrophomonas sp. GD03993]|uniref:hypothetical protein n=1 Tax=unclassified Stenotrophomonas TaxID=196198 RepID=UPI00244B4444|nr:MULTISPECIES: hypothetical protein [unclassified Stenotrophomonas]MDH0187686.1 hypothetical protein [Stenotrophomonas sp. GD04051]MDH0465289.1 hypothetical protein [Stenotrophomonas sp. GD03993]MDH0877866.1 hypothetical protein [Stenotrophomonas sp. GD03877]
MATSPRAQRSRQVLQLPAAPATRISCRAMLQVDALASAGIKRGRTDRRLLPGPPGGHLAQGAAIAPSPAAAGDVISCRTMRMVDELASAGIERGALPAPAGRAAPLATSPEARRSRQVLQLPVAPATWISRRSWRAIMSH